jgi:hypothetical protein
MIVLQPPTLHAWSRLKIVLLSGLSDPTSCALSQTQQEFLRRLVSPSESKVFANFPYHPPDRDTQASVPLLLASWRNLSQFRRAMHSPYREHALQHWQSLVNSCEELFVITLSCGLEILNVCLSTGVRPEKIDVLALGPVARQRPPVPHLLVRGQRDWIVNPWFREVDLRVPDLGHLDYLKSPRIVELAQTRIDAMNADLNPR